MTPVQAELAIFRGESLNDSRGLPLRCYSYDRMIARVTMIVRDEPGYFIQDESAPESEVDAMNAQIGVSRAQRLAMECGSQFGWDDERARPDFHKADA